MTAAVHRLRRARKGLKNGTATTGEACHLTRLRRVRKSAAGAAVAGARLRRCRVRVSGGELWQGVLGVCGGRSAAAGGGIRENREKPGLLLVLVPGCFVSSVSGLVPKNTLQPMQLSVCPTPAAGNEPGYCIPQCMCLSQLSVCYIKLESAVFASGVA